MTSPDAADIRRTQLAHRHGLADDLVRARSVAAVARLRSTDWWSSARSIAIYAAVGGELRPDGLLELRRAHQQLYVPVLGAETLRFAQFDEDTVWHPNRFGIAEPTAPDRTTPPDSIDATLLDLVVVPCVAVDHAGHRIGMGGGWYDRTFSFLGATERPMAPLMIGFVHDEHVVEVIEPAPWDIGLDGVITPTRTILVPTSRASDRSS